MVSSHSQNNCLFQQHACLIENTLQNWAESSKCFPKMNGQWPGICFDGSTAKSRFQCIKEAFIAGVFGNESRRLLFTWRLVQQKKAITRHAFWSVMICRLSFLTIMIISYFITIITQSSISSLHTVWSRKLHPLRTTSGPCACWFLERQEAVGPKAPYAATDKKMKSTARTEKAINNILTNMERHQRSSKHVQTLSGAYCEHRKWMAKVLFYPHWSCVRFEVIVQVWSLNPQDYRRLPLSTRGGCTSIEVFLLFHSAPKIGTHHVICTMALLLHLVATCYLKWLTQPSLLNLLGDRFSSSWYIGKTHILGMSSKNEVKRLGPHGAWRPGCCMITLCIIVLAIVTEPCRRSERTEVLSVPKIYHASVTH